jgi:hypothetical protein
VLVGWRDDPNRDGVDTELACRLEPVAAVQDLALFADLERDEDSSLGDVGQEGRVLIWLHQRDEVGAGVGAQLRASAELRA